MTIPSSRLAAAAMALALTGAASALAQAPPPEAPPAVAGAQPAMVQHIKVHGAALEGNLEGNAVDRDVIVILPPSYAKNPNRRYPVVYGLHGYTITAEQWTREIHVPQTAEAAFAKGAREMIIVLPDSMTFFGGAMYSTSQTTGDFETFITRDLVAYVDSHYRTLADRRSRGLVGHSMGGYGASRLSMHHPEVFGAVYIMSPCCMNAHAVGPNDPAAAALEAVRTKEDAAKVPGNLRAQLALASSWSPNPAKPPLYLDLPVKDGKQQADVVARWDANAPLANVDQWIGAMRRYKAIAIDVGDQDPFRFDAGKLHDVLDGYHVSSSFEIYPGTHTSRVAYRFQDKVIPFFSDNLVFAPAGRK